MARLGRSYSNWALIQPQPVHTSAVAPTAYTQTNTGSITASGTD